MPPWERRGWRGGASAMTRRISGLSEIARDFDAMLIDQFGVLHDGTRPIAGATCLLGWLRRQGKPVVVLSNSAKPAKVGQLAMTALATRVTVQGRYAYLTVGETNLHVIDVSEPTQPRKVGEAMFIMPSNAPNAIGDFSPRFCARSSCFFPFVADFTNAWDVA